MRWSYQSPFFTATQLALPSVTKLGGNSLLSWANLTNSKSLSWLLPCAAHGITPSCINLLIASSLNTSQSLPAARQCQRQGFRATPISCPSAGREQQSLALRIPSVCSGYSWDGAKLQTSKERRPKEPAGTQQVEDRHVFNGISKQNYYLTPLTVFRGHLCVWTRRQERDLQSIF